MFEENIIAIQGKSSILNISKVASFFFSYLQVHKKNMIFLSVKNPGFCIFLNNVHIPKDAKQEANPKKNRNIRSSFVGETGKKLIS